MRQVLTYLYCKALLISKIPRRSIFSLRNFCFSRQRSASQDTSCFDNYNAQRHDYQRAVLVARALASNNRDVTLLNIKQGAEHPASLLADWSMLRLPVLSVGMLGKSEELRFGQAVEIQRPFALQNRGSFECLWFLIAFLRNLPSEIRS